MDAKLLAAPLGFHASLSAVARLQRRAPATFRELCTLSADCAATGSRGERFALVLEAVEAAAEDRDSAGRPTDAAKTDALSLFSALEFLFRTAATVSATPESLRASLAAHTDATGEVLATIVDVWARQKSRPVAATAAAAGGGGALSASTAEFGALLTTDWRVSLALSSSAREKLDAPLVTLAFTVDDPGSGRPVTRSVELTLPEFRRLRTEFRGMLNVVERL